MEQFNQLPTEIQTHVLKEYPNFRQINKQQYKEKYLFDTLYCNLPVSKKEFLNYLKSGVKNFVIYHFQDLITDIYSFSFYNNTYELLQYSMFIDNEDVDEFIIGNDKTVEISYEGWDDLVDHVLALDDIYYDVKTVNYIVSKRGCHINNYAMNYCIKYMDDILALKVGDGGDIGHMYNKLFKLLYLTTSYDVIKGLNHTFFSDSIELQFTGMGDVFNMDQANYDQTLEHIKHNTEEYYESIMQWFTV
jgi:hypothetical protein